MKDYKVTVKVRNNRLLKAIEESGGQPGLKWCEANGLHYVQVNNLINMTESPINRDLKLRPVAERLCEVLNKLPDELWTNEQIRPLERNFTEVEMSHEQLMEMLPSHETVYEIDTDNMELPALVDLTLDRLTEKEKQVLKARYWEDMTLDQAGERLDISANRVRQIEVKALRKLRHPKNSTDLKVFMGL